MSKEAIRQEAVYEACRRIMDRALPLTARNVREELGGGSFSTLVPLLNEFKTKLDNDNSFRTSLAPPPTEIDQFVKRIVTEVWVKSKLGSIQEIKDTELKFEARIGRLEKDLSEAREEITGSYAEIARLEQLLKDSQKRAAELTKENTAKAAQLELLIRQTEQKDQENVRLLERAVQAESLLKKNSKSEQKKEKAQR